MVYMFDTGVDSSVTQNPLSVALQSSGGRKIQPLVVEKTTSLEVGPLTTDAPITLTNVKRFNLYLLHTWNDLPTE